jgi:(E)-4-hydroxy-3-methylbut-2-enyl-diphosphate synthase
MVVSLRGDETREDLAKLKGVDAEFLLLDPPSHLSRLHASRRLFAELAALERDDAVIHVYRPAPPDPSLPKQRATDGSLEDSTLSEFALQMGTQVGGLLVDGLGDGVLVAPADEKDWGVEFLRKTSFGLLQGSRMRSTKTEFVSCPSCGRTLFDLQEVTAQISERTGHLPGVAIAIMGCIVNGPGEMADADFGYVGGAPGKVDLYVGREVVKRNIPNAEACDALVELIKENGRWQDKETAEEQGEAAPVPA